MTATKPNQMRVKEGRTELTIDHQGQDLTFIHPYFGPGTYAEVDAKLTSPEIKLERPTLSQTASLANTVFNSDDKYSNEIKRLMKSNWLLGFTGILYVPKEGAYI